jgi:hypothetical protein
MSQNSQSYGRHSDYSPIKIVVITLIGEPPTMSTLKTVEDSFLLTAYQKAIELNLSPDFIKILKFEISNRKME